MTQPPLANLLAVHDPDPAGLDEIRRDLQQGGEFACVWPPAPGWIAAAAPLPGGAPDDDLVRRQQFAFAEGRDLLVENSGQDPADALRRVAELADLHPDRLASLPGDFGFIRFRERGAATVVRSCGRLVPFYLWREGERCAIATRLGDLVRYLPVEFRLDPLVNAIWAASWGLFPEGRTFLAGVTLLERGHFARLDGQMRRQPYWQPRPQRLAHPTPAQAREHAERLRALLIAKLARDLDPAGGNLLTLSGGVDSSSLGALAAGVVGREVWSWSLLPSQERPDLVQHEMAFIEPLARRYGFTRRWAVHLHERLVLELWREASPIVFHILHPALCRLPAVAREAPVRVLFGGEFADEVCGSVFTVPDWARHTSPARLLLDAPILLRRPRATLGRWAKYYYWTSLRGQEWLVFPRDLLELDRVGQKPLEAFDPAVRAEYLAWWDGKRVELRQDRDPWRYLALNSATMDPFVPMNWEVCSALGVRRSFPFFNREVFELAFECHPAELYGPDTKKLLRAALHNDVPTQNLYREDKGRRDDILVQAIQSRQEAMPAEPLPEETAGILNPASFSNPHATLDYWQFRCLTRLLIFVASLRARRANF